MSSQLSQLVHALPDGVLIVDNKGIIVFANLRLEQLSGYSDDDLVGQSVDRLLAEESQQVHRKERELFNTRPCIRPMASGQPVGLRRKDGSVISVDVELGPITWDGRVMSVATVRDRSDRRGVQDELRLSEERYRTLVETLPLLVTTHAPDGTFQALNPAFEKITGFRRDDWIGRHYLDLVHPDDVQTASNEMDQPRSVPFGGPIRSRIKSATGRCRTLESWGVSLVQGETRKGVVAISRDITDLLDAERQLRSSEARFRGVFEESPLGIVVADRGQMILDVNPAMCRMLGMTRFQLLGRTVADVTDPKDRDKDEEMARWMETGHPTSYNAEKRWLGASGPVLTSVTSSLVEDIGGGFYALHLVEDVTERRRLQDELAADADMATAVLAKLTPREFEVMQLASDGLTAADLGQHLFLSVRTVESHLASIYRKLEVRSRREACARFQRLNELAARDPRNREVPRNGASEADEKGRSA